MTCFAKKMKNLIGFGLGFFLSANTFAADKIVIDVDGANTESVQSALSTLKGLSSYYSFKESKTITLPNGKVRHRFVQHYGNVPVWNTTIVSDNPSLNNAHHSHNPKGTYLYNIEQDLPDVVPSIKIDDLTKILQDLAAQKGLTDTTLMKNLNSELVIKIYDGVAKLVYVSNYLIQEPNISRPFVIVDAKDGTVLEEWEGLTTDSVKASGPGGNEKIGKYNYGTDFANLIASTTDNKTCTMSSPNVDSYNLNHSSNDSGGKIHSFACSENTFQQVNGAYSPINDAHYFGNIVYDMYQTWFKTSPLTFKLILKLHMGNNYENAYWNGSFMAFGDGATMFYPLVSPDVVGHEVSHGFTEQHSGLVYQNQSGGMNEAFSDIAGESTEYFMNSNKPEDSRVDWLVGERIFKGARGKALRYFEDPTRDGHSIGHASNYTNGMEVHSSSGVYNKAFYILANTSGWGVKKAFEIFVVANQSYWTQNSTFDTGACGVKKASDDLKYNATDVINAFSKVGVDAKCGATPPTPPTPPAPGDMIELQNNESYTGLSSKENVSKFFYIDVTDENAQFMTASTYGSSNNPNVRFAYNRIPTKKNNDCDKNTTSCVIFNPKPGRYIIEVYSTRAYKNANVFSSFSW